MVETIVLARFWKGSVEFQLFLSLYERSLFSLTYQIYWCLATN